VGRSVVNIKTMRKFAQIFVAFSEKLNFTYELHCTVWQYGLPLSKKNNSN
jgi:hypothetical protein